ncbi:hypothetical protein CDEST_02007 [Colletotrichum destructivum]|uniref:Uncharacterized protein n=1 Tax=Colletotrichum destructivum TaxID=34406 RepID=A0AAX4I1R9_9PEZI|nr:hypothetical protein CDEST_02007 [Colletotrichum destructivum]
MAVTFEPLVRMPRTCKISPTAAFASAPPDTSTASTLLATTKRRAASSPATSAKPAKRCKSSNPSSKPDSASTPLGRHDSSSSAVPVLPAQELSTVRHVGVSTLAREYCDFSHFFWAMDPGKRYAIIAEIRDDGLDGRGCWSDLRYYPLYANNTCKTTFLLLAEKYLDQKSNQKAMADDKQEKDTMQDNTNTGEGQKPPMSQYGCYRCYTLQPEAAFEAMPPHVVVSPCGRLTMHEGKNDLPAFQEGQYLLRRYCIECGVRDGLYPDNALVESMTNQKWWVCKCRRIHWVAPNESFVECGFCLGKSAFRSVEREGTELVPLEDVPLLELGPNQHQTPIWQCIYGIQQAYQWTLK